MSMDALKEITDTTIRELEWQNRVDERALKACVSPHQAELREKIWDRIAERNLELAAAKAGRLFEYRNEKSKQARFNIDRRMAIEQSERLERARGEEFYRSDDWLRLRYRALQKSNGRCELCGSIERLHVDHIKPRSKYPKLSLDIDNLQVLCRECNLGKSNLDETDWRNR